jgi:hypothetical protein
MDVDDKLWRTLTTTVAPIACDVRIELDCRVARRKRLRQPIVTELTCSVTRDSFDVCKNRLNSEEALSGILDIENPEIDDTWSKYGKVLLHLGRVQPSNAEYHHTPSLAHGSFFDDVIAALLAP